MASLNSLYFKKESLETLLKTIKKKGEKGVELTVSIQDEANDYGQNLSAFVSQSKEDREAQKKRFYVGNGKTFWTDGNINAIKGSVNKIQEEAQEEATSEEDDDLPF